MRVVFLGRMGYGEAMALQAAAAAEVASGAQAQCVLVVEHDPVYTVGKRNTTHNFKVPIEDLRKQGIPVHQVPRGGEATFHGPGQAVLYPILGLRPLRLGARRYVEGLEDIMVRTCAAFGVDSQGRLPGRTGVWVGGGERKIGAVGVQISSGVTSHGLALNVTTDLSFFDAIVPCGIQGKSVTSLQKEMTSAEPPALQQVQDLLVTELCTEYELQLAPD